MLITSNYPRWTGDATTPFVAQLAGDLQKEGWEIDILAPHAPGAARQEVLDGVPIRRFRYLLPESQQTVCYDGGALINLRKHKSNWLKLPALILAELLVTLRLLLTRRYAVVSAHWVLPQGFVAAIAGRLTGTPVVTTIHGGDVFDLQGRVLGLFKRWALRRSAAVTVNSSATRDAIRAIEPAIQPSLIPMGVAVARAPNPARQIEIRNQYRRGTGPLMLFVGRLVREKGLDDLIEALCLLVEKNTDATLVVAGTGQDAEALKALARTRGVEDRVTFLGWIAPEEVGQYMAAADVFVGPSKQSPSGWKEGLGLVFLEAMAASTPVVATASGGIMDIVEDAITGLLVNESAPQEIAAAVHRIEDDGELRETLIENGRKQVEANFTHEHAAHRFSELLDSVRSGR